MKCAACGYVSFERRETCTRCGGLTAGAPPAAPAVAPERTGGGKAGPRTLSREPETSQERPSATRPTRARRSLSRRSPARPERSGQGALDSVPKGAEILEVGERELEDFSRAHAPCEEGSRGAGDFRIQDDLLGPAPSANRPRPFCLEFALDDGEPAEGLESGVARSTAPLFSLDPAASGPGGTGAIIDSDAEVPERFWAPEGARLGRRAAALAIDLVLLAAGLGLFFLGAFVAMVLSGVAPAHLLSASGFEAGLAPFGLLALLSSLAFHVFFHAGPGGTPGKRLMGIEVRSLDGGVPSAGAAAVRWVAAVVGLACAGLGAAWALFDPRRRGWADRLSKTVVADRRRGPESLHPEVPNGVDKPGGHGYHSSAVQGRDSSAGRATD